MFSPGGGIFHSLYKNVRVSVPHKGNIGEPLFLTPYIEAGKLEEGKFSKIRKPLGYFQQFGVLFHFGFFCSYFTGFKIHSGIF